jgi:hypothetical protein
VTVDIYSDEWLADANAELAASACKVGCGAVGTGAVTRTFVARPLGTYSLAGQQLKVSGSFVVIYQCSACGTAGKLLQSPPVDVDAEDTPRP